MLLRLQTTHPRNGDEGQVPAGARRWSGQGLAGSADSGLSRMDYRRPRVGPAGALGISGRAPLCRGAEAPGSTRGDPRSQAHPQPHEGQRQCLRAELSPRLLGHGSGKGRLLRLHLPEGSEPPAGLASLLHQPRETQAYGLEPVGLLL